MVVVGGDGGVGIVVGCGGFGIVVVDGGRGAAKVMCSVDINGTGWLWCGHRWTCVCVRVFVCLGIFLIGNNDGNR